MKLSERNTKNIRVYSKKKVPKLRFSEFGDEWKTSRINRYFKISVSKDLDRNKLNNDKTKEYKYPVYGNAVENKGLIGYYKEYQHESNKITVTARGNLGKAYLREKNFNSVGRLLVLTPITDINTYYVTQYINSRFRVYVESTGVPQLTSPSFKLNKISLPSLNEQNKIASFLSVLDQKIEFMKKKYSLYVNIKRYLLKNLFDHNSEESLIRLKNYNESLQEISLNNVLKESKIKIKDNINKRLSVKLNLKGIVKRIPNSNEIEGATTQYLRKKGQFIYGKQNLYKGAFGIIPSNLDGYLSSTDIPSFDFIKPIDKMWLFYYFSDKDYYTKLERLSTGTGSKRISPDNFLKIKINMPPIEEQREISNMMKLIDTKIENIEKQVILLSKFKKGLLQKMFC